MVSFLTSGRQMKEWLSILTLGQFLLLAAIKQNTRGFRVSADPDAGTYLRCRLWRHSERLSSRRTPAPPLRANWSAGGSNREMETNPPDTRSPPPCLCPAESPVAAGHRLKTSGRPCHLIDCVCVHRISWKGNGQIIQSDGMFVDVSLLSNEYYLLST